MRSWWSGTRGGRTVPIRFQRMRAQDLLAASFPEAVACGETLPPGDLPVPMDHPLVRQTVEDCLHEAMDVDGFSRSCVDSRTGRSSGWPLTRQSLHFSQGHPGVAALYVPRRRASRGAPDAGRDAEGAVSTRRRSTRLVSWMPTP